MTRPSYRSWPTGILAAAVIFPTIAPAAPPDTFRNGDRVERTGKLEVLHVDDFDHHRSEVRHILHDVKAKRSLRLKFGGEPPRDAKTGDFIRVRGQVEDGQIILAANAAGSYETLAAATANVSGEQKTLVMVADFLDASVSCRVRDIDARMFSDNRDKSVDDLYREVSQGNVQVAGTVVGPMVINYSRSGSCDISAWAQAADQQAQALGVDLSAYPRKIYVLPNANACGFAGAGTVGGNPSRAWILRCELPDVYAHELGHNFGMGHASTPGNEYGDTSDVMGASGLGLRGINGAHQEQMGWREPPKVVELTASGTYSVAPVELAPLSTTAPQILKIRKPDTNDWYYLSYRQPLGFDSALTSSYVNGLSIHRHPGYGSSTNTSLLTTMSDGYTYVDAANQISITQRSHDGSHASIQVDLAPACVPASPAVDIAPVSQTARSGDLASYAVTITNRDSSLCGASAWALTSSVPAGWADSLSTATLTLNPGAAATTTWSVVSALGTPEGSYALTFSVADATSQGHSGSAPATYTVATFLDTLAPTTPTGLSVSQVRRQMNLSWKPATDNVAVAGYRILRNGTVLATTANVSYADTQITVGASYTYQIVAFDPSNNVSDPGSSVMVTAKRK